MAKQDPNNLLETLGEVVSKRLKTATKEQIAELVDILFGKTIERLNKSSNKSVKQQQQQQQQQQNKEKTASPPPGTGIQPQPTAEVTESKLEKRETPTIIEGFSPQAVKELQKVFPESLGDSLAKLSKGFGDLTKSLGNLADLKKGSGFGALGVLGLLFGALSLLSGLADTGPFKGLKTLVGKLSIKGAIAALKVPFSIIKAFKNNFIQNADKLKKVIPNVVTSVQKNIDDVIAVFKSKVGNMVKVITSPIKGFFDNIFKRVTGFFGGFFKTLRTSIFGVFAKEGTKGAAKTAAKTGGGFLAKWLPKIAKFLKGVPFIGTLISIGSAWSRFKTGDVVGGVIDVLSAIVAAIPIPGASFIAFGIDALNAVLDFKAGGSDVAGGKAKPKGEILWGWLKDLGNWVLEKIKLVPGVADLFEGFSLIFSGKFVEGFEKIPLIGDIIRAFNNPDSEAAAGNWFAAGITSPVKGFLEMMVNFFSDMLKNIGNKLKNIGLSLFEGFTSWFSGNDKPKEQTKKDKKEVPKVKDGVIDPKGGLVLSSPNEGDLFQFSKNDAIIAGPWTNKTDVNVKVDNKVLAEVANNTKMTNQGILQLASGFMALAKQLSVVASSGNSKQINAIVGSSEQKESTADIVKRIGSTPITNFRQTLAQQAYTPI